MALYPSPAGATESLLPLPAWESLVRQNPILNSNAERRRSFARQSRRGKRDYFLAPIDKCFELVGTIRTHWRGLSGGEEVWREIERFFARLNAEDA